jgi:hypothetical protein
MACLASVTKLFLQLLHPHYKVSLLGAKPLKHLPLMVNIPMTSAYWITIQNPSALYFKSKFLE